MCLFPFLYIPIRVHDFVVYHFVVCVVACISVRGCESVCVFVFLCVCLYLRLPVHLSVCSGAPLGMHERTCVKYILALRSYAYLTLYRMAVDIVLDSSTFVFR